MSDAQYAERRRHERARVALYIDWGFTSSCAQQARLTSISAGGCFVQTAEAAHVGQTVYIRLGLPSGRILRGEVRYHMTDVGFGVMFVDVTIEDRLALEELVEHYKKQG